MSDRCLEHHLYHLCKWLASMEYLHYIHKCSPDSSVVNPTIMAVSFEEYEIPTLKYYLLLEYV